MSAIAPHARMTVGVVVERRKAASAWADYVWRPVAILPGVPDAAPWTPIDTNEDRVTYFAGAADIELYRSETANYRDNLILHRGIWVALQPTYLDPPYELWRVTADPAEGEALSEAGDNLVEPVPMPEAVYDFVGAFVVEHAEHADDYRFIKKLKRERERADPEALARRRLIDEGS